MRVPASSASTLLLSLLPRALGSFVLPTRLATRPAATMVSTSNNNNDITIKTNREDLEQKSFKPVHIYPYSSDLSTLEATNQYAKLKRFHVIRHAEGTHNVNREYKDIINLDARLTDLGKEQCQSLAEKLAQAAAVTESSSPTDKRISSAEDSYYRDIIQKTELVVTSPLTRCLETALLSFPSLAETAPENPVNQKKTKIPFVAHESVRETVNYACDRRRAISSLEPHYHERVCFQAIEHDHDELWESYLRRLGSSEEWDNRRESAELHAVADRARDFLAWVRERDEKEIIVCTHSAFLRCILSWGQAGGVPMMMPQVLETRPEGSGADEGVTNTKNQDSSVFMTQNLDNRRKAAGDNETVEDIPVFQYCGDAAFEEYMRRDYENCELRSFVAAFPHHM